jgi:phosphoserine phosphatase
MALTKKRVAFFDVDNTLLKGSTLFFLGRGMYQRGFFTKRDVSAFVLANLRYRLTGKRIKVKLKDFRMPPVNLLKATM